MCSLLDGKVQSVMCRLRTEQKPLLRLCRRAPLRWLPLGALRLRDRQLKRQALLVPGTDSNHQPRMPRQAAPNRHQTLLQSCQQIGSEQIASAHPSVAAARQQQRRCTTPKRFSCGSCSAAKWCVSTCTVAF